MKIVIEDTCHNCNGMGWTESKATGVRTCLVCNGRRVSQQTVSLEDFAKLFHLVTIAEQRDDCLSLVYRTEIRAVPSPSGGEK